MILKNNNYNNCQIEITRRKFIIPQTTMNQRKPKQPKHNTLLARRWQNVELFNQSFFFLVFCELNGMEKSIQRAKEKSHAITQES